MDILSLYNAFKIIFYINLIGRTVPDSTPSNNNNNINHTLQNPIKLSELRTWLISKPFPEQRIRDEYEVNLYKFINLNYLFFLKLIRNYLLNLFILKH